MKTIFFSRTEKILYQSFKKNPESKKTNKNIILVECSEDIYYLSIFGSIINSIKSKIDVSPKIYISRNFSIGESSSFVKFIFYRAKNLFFFTKYFFLYKSFCNYGLGFLSNSVIIKLTNIELIFYAYAQWKMLKKIKT